MDFYVQKMEVYRGIPNKVTKVHIEITLEIFGPENQFSYFWKAEAFSYLAG